MKQWVSNREHHHDNDTMQDGDQTLSSFSHPTAASTISSGNDEKTNTNTSVKFSNEKSKNDDDFRIASSI